MQKHWRVLALGALVSGVVIYLIARQIDFALLWQSLRTANYVWLLPAITLTPEGAALASRGGFIGPSHVAANPDLPKTGRVRLLHPDGHLIAIAEPRASGVAGLLHPSVVLE